MIAYFDTSAIVKLLIDEPGSDISEQAWRVADDRVCVTVGITEAAAAIARARRIGRINETIEPRLLSGLNHLWTGVSTLIVDDQLASQAADLTADLDLRGYGAVHLAAAQSVGATLVSSDIQLLPVARSIDISIVDVRH